MDPKVAGLMIKGSGQQLYMRPAIDDMAEKRAAS